MIPLFKLASKATIVSRECVIVAARMIPTTGASTLHYHYARYYDVILLLYVDLAVLSRQIRVAIFDGKNVNTVLCTLVQYITLPALIDSQ